MRRHVLSRQVHQPVDVAVAALVVEPAEGADDEQLRPQADRHPLYPAADHVELGMLPPQVVEVALHVVKAPLIAETAAEVAE